MFKLSSAWSQSQGKRDYQQDGVTRQVWPNGFVLIVLSDGMGGAVHGDIASEEILLSFNQSFSNSEESDITIRLQDSLYHANNHLSDYVQRHSESRGMGGTLVATAYTGKELYWISVGDSPLWLVRNGEFIRLNQEHSVKAELTELVAAGEMTPEELLSHPSRNQLTSAVMGEEINLIDCNSIELQTNDLVLLASDGIESVSEDILLSICQRFCQAEPQALADYIVSYVDNMDKAHQDNSTVVVMKFL